MKNSVYEDIKQKFGQMCKDKNICWTDALIYMIYSEYPIYTIGEEQGDVEKCYAELENDYDELRYAQPSLEENEDLAFAIQHARDVFDVLLGRDGVI